MITNCPHFLVFSTSQSAKEMNKISFKHFVKHMMGVQEKLRMTSINEQDQDQHELIIH